METEIKLNGEGRADVPVRPAEPQLRPTDVLRETQPWLRRLNYDGTPAALAQLQKDLELLYAEAKDDAHDVLAPTHVVELDGKIIGYASIGAIPMVNLWLSSKQQRPRDAMQLLNQVENVAANLGFQNVVVPCWEKSPFHKLMTRFGYQFLMTSDYFIKKLRG